MRCFDDDPEPETPPDQAPINNPKKPKEKPPKS